MAEKLEVKAVSIDRLALMYGVHHNTVRNAIRAGKLRFSRIGRRIVIRIVDAEKWIGASKRGERAQKV